MRPRSLLLVLLAAASTPAALAASVDVVHETPARLEVLEGRASAALPSSVLRMEGGSPPQQFRGAVHLELAPASRARVGWSGLGSLLLEGHAVVEWSPPAERDSVMRWTFSDVDTASLEVRRGRVHLELPGGWRGLLQPGAYSLRGLAGGPVEFRHEAGLPVTFWPPAGRKKAQPPYTVLAGSAVRLFEEAPTPVALPGSTVPVQAPQAKLGYEARSAPASFPAWSGFWWPWKRSEADETSRPGPSVPTAAAIELEGHGPLGERLPVAHAVPQPGAAASEAAGRASSLPSPSVLAQGDAVEAAGAHDEIVPGASVEGKRAPLAPGTPRGKPAETKTAGSGRPAPTYAPVRREGVLVLTPYGPRWVDVPTGIPQKPPQRKR